MHRRTAVRCGRFWSTEPLGRPHWWRLAIPKYAKVRDSRLMRQAASRLRSVRIIQEGLHVRSLTFGSPRRGQW